MRTFLTLLIITVLVSSSCSDHPKIWQLSKTIPLQNIHPIGIASTDEGLWLSDVDRNRLVLVNAEGNLLRTVDSLERPMHITSENNALYVPLYGNDIVVKISKKAELVLPVNDSLDAPAGISVHGSETAIADFYNHRILYAKDGRNFISFGTKGKEAGQFHYPTDVQVTARAIWVADAYNKRVQVFDKEGNFLMAIGAGQKIKAATGLYVSEQEVVVSDFENNQVLVFDHDGTLLQVLTEGIDKPTDVLVERETLYITNYKSGELLVLTRSPK